MLATPSVKVLTHRCIAHLPLFHIIHFLDSFLLLQLLVLFVAVNEGTLRRVWLRIPGMACFFISKRRAGLLRWHLWGLLVMGVVRAIAEVQCRDWFFTTLTGADSEFLGEAIFSTSRIAMRHVSSGSHVLLVDNYPFAELAFRLNCDLVSMANLIRVWCLSFFVTRDDLPLPVIFRWSK